MSMTNVCALPGCKHSVPRRKNSNLSWHKFPYHDVHLLDAWVEACKTLDCSLPKGWRPSSNSYLCSAHFKPTDFRNRELKGSRVCLLSKTVPSLFAKGSGFEQYVNRVPSKTPNTIKGASLKPLRSSSKKPSVVPIAKKAMPRQKKRRRCSGDEIDGVETNKLCKKEDMGLYIYDDYTDDNFRDNDYKDNSEPSEMEWNAVDGECDSQGASMEDKGVDWEKHRLTGMCRVCASTRNKLIPVYGDIGHNLEIADRIHTFLPILVTRDDLLPVSICHRCLSNLKQSQMLVETCLLADKKLRDLLEARMMAAENVDYFTKDDGVDIQNEEHTDNEDAEPLPPPSPSPPSPVLSTKARKPLSPRKASKGATTRKKASARMIRRTSEYWKQQRRNEILALDLGPRHSTKGSKVPNILRRKTSRSQSEQQENLSPVLLEKIRSCGIKEASVVITKVDIPENTCSAVVTKVAVPVNNGRSMARSAARSSTSRRLFRCLYCNQTDTDAYMLLLHQLSVHPGNLLRCPHCAFLCGSDQKQKFDTHVMSHSENQNNPAIESQSESDVKDVVTIDISDEEAEASASTRILCIKSESPDESGIAADGEIQAAEMKIIPSLQNGPIRVIVSSVAASAAASVVNTQEPLPQQLITFPNDHNGANGDNGSVNECSEIDQLVYETIDSRPPVENHTPSQGSLRKTPAEQQSCAGAAQTPKASNTYMLRINVEGLQPHKTDPTPEASPGAAGAAAPAGHRRTPLVPVTLYQCARCRMNYDSKESVEKHVCVQNNLIPIAPKPGGLNYACTTCGQVFSESAEFREHSLLHSTSFKCHVCDATFRSELTLKNHFRRHTEKKEKYPCPHCDKVFSLRSRLRVHLFSHSDEPRCVCPQCGKVFRTDGGFRAHIRAHENKRPFACSICGQRFNRSGNMRRHERTCDRNKSLTCKFCSATFEQHDDLLVHRATNHADEEMTVPIPDVKRKSKEKRFTCRVCSLEFARVVDMRKHQTESHTETELEKVKDVPDGGAYLCHTCGKQLYHKHNYRMHMLHHLGKGFFKCDLCPSMFTSKFALNYHSMLHTGEFPHKCSMCNEGFRSTIALQVHRFKHTGEKPFRCRLCDMSFFSSHSLRLHSVVHSNERSFVCKVCGQTFKRKKTLHYHSLIHTGEKPYKCNICGRAFRQKGTCNIHERNHAMPRRSKDAHVSHAAQKTQHRLHERLKNLQWQHPTTSDVKETIFIVRETDDIKSVPVHETSVETEIIDSGLLSMYPDLEVKDHAEIVDDNVKSSLGFSTPDQTISIIQ